MNIIIQSCDAYIWVNGNDPDRLTIVVAFSLAPHYAVSGFSVVYKTTRLLASGGRGGGGGFNVNCSNWVVCLNECLYASIV